MFVVLLDFVVEDMFVSPFFSVLTRFKQKDQQDIFNQSRILPFTITMEKSHDKLFHCNETEGPVRFSKIMAILLISAYVE